MQNRMHQNEIALYNPLYRSWRLGIILLCKSLESERRSMTQLPGMVYTMLPLFHTLYQIYANEREAMLSSTVVSIFCGYTDHSTAYPTRDANLLQ